MPGVLAAQTDTAVPIIFTWASAWDETSARLPAAARAFAEANGFKARAGQYLALPAESGAIAHVLFALENPDASGRDPFRTGALPGLLPAGTFRFGNATHDDRLAVLGFLLGNYRFARYRSADAAAARLVPPPHVPADEIERMAGAVALARDLINTPANDMGPDELESAARDLAETTGASMSVIRGDDLRAANFPLIHAVGRASARAPRLIDLTWGDPSHPRVTLVGKGVVFDTGGLDLKPSSSMLLMKKDMAGAACVLALARLVMQSKLKVRLRVLIPAVENAVGGDAFRPMDILPSRKGPTVEIGNTDAEGRLILADALALAFEESPELVIDLGTLTGAARVALGPDLPPFYTGSDTLAADLARCASLENDPLWRMPLWPAYDKWLEAKAADINNAPSNGFAGSITCALFLQRFVADPSRWLHVDIYGWTPTARPGRPEGGECQASRALFRLLGERYG